MEQVRAPLAAVIVLYGQRFSETSADSSLLKAATEELRHIFVYDNSPTIDNEGSEELSALGITMHYLHDPSNGGLVPAYNWACEKAGDAGCEWILLLDQHATLPGNYLRLFCQSLHLLPQDVVAATSYICSGARRLSPQWVYKGIALPWPIKPGLVGPQRRELVSINSGTFVNISHIRNRGGWDRRYKLDAVDFWFFADVYRSGNRVALLPCEIQHALSVANLSQVDVQRFENIVGAESAFYRHMRPRSTQIAAGMLCLARACKHFMHGHRALAKIGAHEALKLLKAKRTAS